MPIIAIEVGPEIIQSVALIIEFMMMAFFLSIVVYPLNSIYRKTEIGFKEIILASPATAGDIFIGEFIGKFPIYIGGVLIITPIIIGLLNPIISLSLIQYFVIYLCIFGLLVFATLLGSIIASWLEHKIAKSERAKDLGRVILFLLSIAIITIIYSLQFFFTYLVNNPQLRNWLSFYPSIWFSNIILYIINPTLISSYLLNIWASTSLVLIFPLFILYVAFKKADRFFRIEGGIEKLALRIEKENKFYVIIRKFTGHKWEGLIITQLKEFLRKRENIMKIVYITGLVGVLSVLYSITFPLETGSIGESLIIIILIYIGGIMYGMLFGSYIFVGTKDLLWVYKRSPRNVPVLIYSFMGAMFIFNILMSIGLTIFLSIFLQLDLSTMIFFFVFFVINCEIVISQAIGIQCYNPSFLEKGRIMTTNIVMLVLIQMIPFQLLGTMLFLFSQIPLSGLGAKFFILSPLLLTSLATAIPLLYFGTKKLSKIE
ncbi:MAG: hypothetical protein ACW99E_05525 [Promethearchaeota archaeon]|jgi:hypothetical protein